jgi:hypothetical protein
VLHDMRLGDKSTWRWAIHSKRDEGTYSTVMA